MVAKGDSFTIQAAFYDIGAQFGEDALTNPTTPRVSIVGANGVALAGSPFAMGPLPAPITGIVYYTLNTNGLADDQYSYVCYDAAEPTPTIAHSQGWFSIEDNDLDSLDAEIDALPTAAAIADAVWDEATAGHVSAGTTGKAVVDILAFGAPPSAGAVADSVWDEATAGHTTAGTFGKKLGDITVTTDGAIADAVWDEATSGHTTTGTFGKAYTETIGPGAGATNVTKDTGGSNALRPEVSGVAQSGVTIEAYLTSDWSVGPSNRTSAYRRGSTTTDSNGDFTLTLPAGAYTLYYFRTRSGSTDGLTGTTTTVTVS